MFRERDSAAPVLELGAATTVTVAEQLTSPVEAVMVALPGAMPVTLPKLLTVATLGSEEVSVTSM